MGRMYMALSVALIRIERSEFDTDPTSQAQPYRIYNNKKKIGGIPDPVKGLSPIKPKPSKSYKPCHSAREATSKCARVRLLISHPAEISLSVLIQNACQ